MDHTAATSTEIAPNSLPRRSVVHGLGGVLAGIAAIGVGTAADVKPAAAKKKKKKKRPVKGTLVGLQLGSTNLSIDPGGVGFCVATCPAAPAGEQALVFSPSWTLSSEELTVLNSFPDESFSSWTIWAKNNAQTKKSMTCSAVCGYVRA